MIPYDIYDSHWQIQSFGPWKSEILLEPVFQYLPIESREGRNKHINRGSKKIWAQVLPSQYRGFPPKTQMNIERQLLQVGRSSAFAVWLNKLHQTAGSWEHEHPEPIQRSCCMHPGRPGLVVCRVCNCTLDRITNDPKQSVIDFWTRNPYCFGLMCFEDFAGLADFRPKVPCIQTVPA